ncbi:MAG: hypothetical protein QOH87_85 [Trebonia sp.]|jgi:hypothetical protein|nr:hypothetical protein [Trebonia sp.]
MPDPVEDGNPFVGEEMLTCTWHPQVRISTVTSQLARRGRTQVR